MQQDETKCEHPSTVELYFGIMKCSACGAMWDIADEATKEHRASSQGNAEHRARKQEYYRRKHRGKKGKR